MLPRSTLLAAIGALVVVGTAFVGVRTMHAKEDSLLGAAQMAGQEPEPPKCGTWPAAGTPIIAGPGMVYAYECASTGLGSPRVNMSLKDGGSPTAAMCAEFCEKLKKPAKYPFGKLGWCCELRGAVRDATGEQVAPARCSWMEGEPAVVKLPVALSNVTAYAACAPPARGEYTCPNNTMHDAIKLDGDGPGLCSQICLPPGLFNIAEKRGVIHGRCDELGVTVFKYVAAQAGVKVRFAPGLTRECGRRARACCDSLIRRPSPSASRSPTTVQRL
jgi:hypothetical protein